MGAEKLNDYAEAVYLALQKMPFFSNFPIEFLHELAGACDLIQFQVGDEVLTQGQYNSHLYFLIDGRVSVAVDNGIVAEMMSVGDVLGEMSVITKLPCTATIIADSEVLVLRLGVEALEESESAKTDRFKYLLYRVYSSILTKKLNETNHKAKHLETMSMTLERAQRELQDVNSSLEKRVHERTQDLQIKSEALQNSHQKLEQQNLELVTSYKKLEELYTTKNLAFSKLEELYTNHLCPLEEDLVKLRPNISEEAEPLFAQVSRSLTETLSLLKPISEVYSTEQAMKSKKVMLIEGNKKQQLLAKLALGGTGVDLQIVAHPDELKSDSSIDFDIIFLDSSSFEKSEMLRQKYPNADFVLLTSDSIKDSFPILHKAPELPNIVSRADNDRTFTVKNIVTTVAKLTSKDFFGLEKYLAWGADVKSAPVVSSDKRVEYIGSMTSYFENLGVRRTTRERAALVSEELLMNAIYDAPVDSAGQSLFNHQSRKETVYLKPNQQCKFRYATDGMLLAVSVEDPFGSLSGRVILEYLDSCYGNSAGSLNAKKGGAGRGLHQIIENSDLVVFNIHPNKKTEVIALFNLDKNDSLNTGPSFHLFIV